MHEIIEGNKLNKNQLRAVAENGENIAVNAGAGSGKTKTILSKVIYLLNQNVDPSKILIMCFANKPARELRRRLHAMCDDYPELRLKLKLLSIGDKGSDISNECPKCGKKGNSHQCSDGKYITRRIHTFHSLCFDLFKEYQNHRVADYLGSNSKFEQEVMTQKFFQTIITYISKKEPDIYNRLNNYFSNFLVLQKNPLDNEEMTMENYERYMRPDYVTLKPIKNSFDMMEQLQVKSKEEVNIANFLYLRGIEFIYEDKYEGELPKGWRNNYHPDFHLYKKNKHGEVEYDVWYEHFGLNKNMKAPSFYKNGGKDYEENVKVKQKIHKGNLICTYSYQQYDGSLFEELTKQLKAKGIDIPKENIMDNDNVFEEFIQANYFTKFSKLLNIFLQRFKENENLSLIDLSNQLSESDYASERKKAFLEIFNIFYKEYQNYLYEQEQIDFADMIIEGKKYIKNQNIEYLLIDEFQDISPLRANVIKRIKNCNPNLQLFTVGDDWQSIYGFSGSEIDIIIDDDESNKHCGCGPRKHRNLTETYRFNNRLCELSNTFISKNPQGQLKKNMTGNISYNKIPTYFYHHKNGVYKIDFSLKLDIVKKIHNIFSKNPSVKKILFLSRYNDYTYNTAYQHLQKYLHSIFKSKKDRLVFSTIHSAKGSEADYVFVMNIKDGIFGFPSTIEDDPVLDLVANKKDDFEHAEERRLFYVALTRTKKDVFVYGEKESYFFNQIINDHNNKEGHHYAIDEIPHQKKPSSSELVIKSINKMDHNPAKKAGIKKNDVIIAIDNRKTSLDSNFMKIISDYPNLKEEDNDASINLMIKRQNKLLEVNLMPYLKSRGNKKPYVDIGFKYFEREIHPFINEMEKIYTDKMEVKKAI